MKENKFKKLFEKLNSLDTRELHTLIQRMYHEQEAYHKIFNLVNDGILILTNSCTIEYGNHVANEIFGLIDQQHSLEHYVPELSFLKQSMQKCKISMRFTIKELEIKYPHRKTLSISGIHLVAEHKNDFLSWYFATQRQQII
jgi:nitrogen-specific signal transduction histidine kinase